jgi:hypothetical protein
MKGTAFFLVVLMAAILLLLGEYKPIRTLVVPWTNFTTGKLKVLIFSSIELTLVAEQQYSAPMALMSAIAHGSNIYIHIQS